MNGMSSVVLPMVIGCGPPKNNVTMKALIVIVFMNSARKKRANLIEEYSVLNPPTSSCSASTRSNGGRFSSAVADTRKMRNGTMPVAITFHEPSDNCEFTIPLVDNVPHTRITAASDKPSDAS